VITCENCKHFEPLKPGHWSGSCNIQLPRWVTVVLATVMDSYATVRIDDSCDLGETKE